MNLHPERAATIAGLFWTGMYLIGSYASLSQHRYRLRLSSKRVRQRTAFGQKTILLTTVTRLTWRPKFQGGCIDLRSGGRRILIVLAMLPNLAARNAVVTHLQEHVPAEVQHNWAQEMQRSQSSVRT